MNRIGRLHQDVERYAFIADHAADLETNLIASRHVRWLLALIRSLADDPPLYLLRKAP